MDLGPSGGGPSGGGGGSGERPPRGEEERDLGKAGDRVKAWSLATLEGSTTFTKYQQNERAQYTEVLEKIHDAAVEDRLSGADVRSLLMKGLAISKNAGGQGASIKAQIEAFEAEFTTKLVDSAQAETLTPKLNELQWRMTEVLIYGHDSKELSAAKVASFNRKFKAHEAKEEKAKADGKLTDLERRRLDEGAQKLWGQLVKAVKRRGD